MEQTGGVMLTYMLGACMNVLMKNKIMHASSSASNLHLGQKCYLLHTFESFAFNCSQSEFDEKSQPLTRSCVLFLAAKNLMQNSKLCAHQNRFCITRAGRKSQVKQFKQVKQCLGFSTADFWSSLPYQLKKIPNIA